MAIVRRTINNNNALVKKVIYRDIQNIFLNPNNDRTNISVVENEESISQSILNLLLTMPGERPFQKELGSGINKLLFENISPQTSTAIVQLIKTTITNHEPRARIIGVEVTPSEDENSYVVYIAYSVINRSEPIVLEFVLNRVR